jgi:hypothetical protein
MRQIVTDLLQITDWFQEKEIDWHCQNGDFRVEEDEDGKYGPTWPELDLDEVRLEIIDQADPEVLTEEEIEIILKSWSAFDLADCVKEVVADQAAYNRDEYAYFGVSRKDFF